MVYAQPNVGPEEWDTQTSFGFCDTNESTNLRPCNNQREKKKENLPNCGLCCPGWPQSKIERKRKEGLVPRLCKRIEKTQGHESDDDTICNWCSWFNHQRISTRNRGLGNKRTSVDYPTCSTIEYWEESRRLEEICCHSNYCDLKRSINHKELNNECRLCSNRDETVIYIIR